MTAWDAKAKQLVSVPACVPAKVVDTLGAGDCFIASVIFAHHLLGFDFRHSLIFGCKVAGDKVGMDGYDGLVCPNLNAIFNLPVGPR